MSEIHGLGVRAAGAQLLPYKYDPGVLRADEVEIKDTWFFAGMRGTGSNTVVADRVFVPGHRIMPFARFADAAAAPESIAGGRPRSGLAGLFVGLLGALIGGTDAALGYVLESGPRRPVAASTYRNQAQSPTFQLAVADAREHVQHDPASQPVSHGPVAPSGWRKYSAPRSLRRRA